MRNKMDCFLKNNLGEIWGKGVPHFKEDCL